MSINNICTTILSQIISLNSLKILTTCSPIYIQPINYIIDLKNECEKKLVLDINMVNTSYNLEDRSNIPSQIDLVKEKNIVD